MMIKKEYISNKEKILDFLIGFVGMFVIRYILQYVSILLSFIFSLTAHPILTDTLPLLIAYSCLVLFFYKKRKYVSIGILAQFFIVILIGGLFAYLMYRTGETM